MERLRRPGGSSAMDAVNDPSTAAGSPGKRTLAQGAAALDANEAGAAGRSATRRPPVVTALLLRINGRSGELRAALVRQPELRGELEAYLASADDPMLNDLLARAFPRRRSSTATEPTSSGIQPPAEEAPPEEVEEVEKAPRDASLALPAPRADTKTLSRGVMTWKLQPVSHIQARAEVDFLPDKTKVDAKNVSFVQTVLNTLGGNAMYAGASVRDPVGGKSRYSPYEEAKAKRRVDHEAGTENDPYYGAEWDPAARQWKNESGGSGVGSSRKGVSSSSARMNDNPITGLGREGKGDTIKEFETVPVVLETREPLGALTWGYKIQDREDAPIELIGATQADCSDAPSATWGAALDKFYEAKFEILDGFAQDKADLAPAHATILDGLVTRLKGKPSLTAQIGGAADRKDAEPAKVSQARADAAKDYLVSRGIDAARITTQAYGGDWARVATTAGASEPKNRRVQIWVK